MNLLDTDYVRIYLGPGMIAKGLVARLNDIGISPLERDDHQSATRAGFASGILGQMVLFVRNDELEKAKPVIEQYLKEVS